MAEHITQACCQGFKEFKYETFERSNCAMSETAAVKENMEVVFDSCVHQSNFCHRS